MQCGMVRVLQSLGLSHDAEDNYFEFSKWLSKPRRAPDFAVESQQLEYKPVKGLTRSTATVDRATTLSLLLFPNESSR